jgi:hypothetical protein
MNSICPCPFCASHSFCALEVDAGSWAVICDECKGMGPAAERADEAVRFWNIRRILAPNPAPAKSLQGKG